MRAFALVGFGEGIKLSWENCEDFDQHAALVSFFTGVGEHEKGAKVWSDCLDESK